MLHGIPIYIDDLSMYGSCLMVCDALFNHFGMGEEDREISFHKAIAVLPG